MRNVLMICIGVLLALVLSAPNAAAEDTASFSGQVVERGSQVPVPGARVLLGASPPLGTNPSPAATSDSAGRFTFAGLPGGLYAVTAMKLGYILGGPSSTFELAPGQHREDVVVTIERGGVIRGRVVDPLGNPVAEARVLILQRARPEARPKTPIYWPLPRFEAAGGAQTNDIGEFRLIGLRSGTYFIGASPPPFVSYKTGTEPPATRLADTLYPSTLDVEDAQPIPVTAGLTLSDVVIRLVATPALHISGIVVDERGAPVAGATVTVDPATAIAAGGRGTTSTNSDGEFSIAVVPGSYEVTVSAPLKRPVRPPDPTRKRVTVEHVNVTDLRIVVRTAK